MKKVKWCCFLAFLFVSAVLAFNSRNITFQPWITELPMEWIGYASGNDNAIAVIVDSSKTVVVINNEGELLYKVRSGMNLSRSFYSAGFVKLDDENNLFVSDRNFGGAFRESTERILKFSSAGRFLGIVYSISYLNEDFIIMKGKLSGMAIDRDTLYLVRLEHHGFYLEAVNTRVFGQEPNLIKFFPYQNAFRELSFAQINTATRRLVWTTITGTILEYSFTGRLIREIPADDYRQPYMALSDDNNDIVFVDVWNYKIGRICAQTDETTILYQPDDAFGVFYNYINSNNNRIIASYVMDDVLVINADGTYKKLSSFSFSHNQIIVRYILFVLCIINVVLLVTLLLWAAGFISKKRTSALFKQIMLFGSCIILGASISSLIIIRDMQRSNTESTYSELENISRLIIASLDVDLIKSLNSPRQFDSEEYLAFSNQITSLFERMEFDGKPVGSVIWVERNGVIFTVYDLEHSHQALFPWGKFEGSFVEEVFNAREFMRFQEILPSGTWDLVHGPIFDNDGNMVAVFEIILNTMSIQRENRMLILQTALIVIAVTVAFLLLIIECLMLFDAYNKNKNSRDNVIELKLNLLRSTFGLLFDDHDRKSVEGRRLPAINRLIKAYEAKAETGFYPELLRAAAFVMFFSLNFANAILPLYSADIYVPVLNLPREFVITLPFMALSIFIVIALIIIPGILVKIGVKKVSCMSAFLLVAGNAVCIFANNVLHLSVGYALMGLSSGVFILIFNTIVGSQKNAEDRNNGFAHLSAAYLVGLNVGVVFGAMIAQFFPYRTLFFFSTAISLIFLGIILFSQRSSLFDSFYDVQYATSKNIGKFTLLKFIFRPVVLCILLLALVPFVVTTSFVDYFMPVFAIDSGLGETNIGQLMLLNGLFAILFGVSLCQLVAKKMPILIAVIFPLLLAAGALYLFSLNVSIGMLIVTIVIIAIANIFALTNIQTYFSILYQNSRIDSLRALSAFSVVENTAMAVGPVVFSYILAGSIGFGMKTLSVIILACSVVFVIVSIFSVKWNFNTLEKISSMDQRGEIRKGIVIPYQK